MSWVCMQVRVCLSVCLRVRACVRFDLKSPSLAKGSERFFVLLHNGADQSCRIAPQEARQHSHLCFAQQDLTGGTDCRRTSLSLSREYASNRI